MERSSPMLKRITVPRRIMLLLLDNHKYADSYEVMEVVSQSGIAKELNLRQNHVSRALSELDSENLIFSRSSHVKGVFRKRKVYFLTQKGMVEINDFIENLSKKKVLVHTKEGELREWPLGKVIRELKKILGYAPTYHQLLTRFPHINEIDLNDISDFKKDLSIKKKLNVPMARHFYGRSTESELIHNSLRGDSHRIIIINSIAGQGKTALMIKVISRQDERPVYWISLSEWSRLSNLLNDWSYFLKEHNRTTLFNYLGRTSQIKIQDALKAFLKDTRGISPIFIIDDFQKADIEIVRLFKQLKDLIIQEKGLTFLISSRERPDFYGRKDVHVSKSILELELSGLDKDSALKILEEKGLAETDFDTAFQVTKGHPLALELYTPSLFSDGVVPNLEFDTFLGEEVIKSLSTSESEVVKLASVFQRPVSHTAFFFSNDINQEVIDGLCNKLILRAYRNGSYDVHDLIKSYFLNRLTFFEKQKYLDIAVDYYSNRGSEKEILEYLRLLKELDDDERFLRAFLENGDFLLSQGYTQVGEYLQDISDESLSDFDRIRLLILRADNAISSGNRKQARAFLTKGLQTCEQMISKSDKNTKEEIVPLLSRIYNRNAEISKLEGRFEDTIKAYKDSVKLNKTYGNSAEVGKALNNLALVYRERGELNSALDQLNDARVVFQEISDQNAEALVVVNIGDIYFLKGDHKRANASFQEVEKIVLKYPEVRGLIYGKIGRTRLKMALEKKAESSLLESLQAYHRSNDIYNQIRNLNDLFKCASALKNKKAALSYLDTASSLMEEHYESHKRSGLWNTQMNELMKNKILHWYKFDQEKFNRYLKDYMKYHTTDPNPVTILEDVEQFSKHLAADPQDLLKIYTGTTDIFQNLKDKHPLIILSLRRAELLMDMGKKKDARAVLEKSHPIATRIGFKKGILKIEEKLEKL